MSSNLIFSLYSLKKLSLVTYFDLINLVVNSFGYFFHLLPVEISAHFVRVWLVVRYVAYVSGVFVEASERRTEAPHDFLPVRHVLVEFGTDGRPELGLLHF